MKLTLILFWMYVIKEVHTCYALQTESIRRDVISVVPQKTLVGCQLLCNADDNCQATLLNAAGTDCVLLGSQIADSSSNACPKPFESYVKTESGCVDIPQGPIAADYSPGTCSRATDVVGDLATESSPVCGSPPLGPQRRMVIDAIQHDGTHITLENYRYSYAVWDAHAGSWYLELEDTPNGERYYFKSAKCVLAPSPPLAPSCDCAPLPTEPADDNNSNPTVPIPDVDPVCANRWIQYVPLPLHGMSYLRTVDRRTYVGDTRMLTCLMGVWMVVLTTEDDYNSYSLAAATCVD